MQEITKARTSITTSISSIRWRLLAHTDIVDMGLTSASMVAQTMHQPLYLRRRFWEL